MVVRELIALLRFKTDPGSVKKTEDGVNKLIGYAKAAAAAFAGFKLAQWAKDAAEQTAVLGDSLAKMSIRTDASVKSLQELGYAAQLSGSDIGAIEGAISSLRSAQFAAMMGSAEHAKTFGILGVSIRDASGRMRSAADLIPEVADALNRFSDSTWKASLANKAFGGSGLALLPMLSSGSAGIRAMMHEARMLGGVIDSRLVRSSERFVENQKRMGSVLQGVRNAIARALLPFMIKAQESFIRWIKINGDWLRTKITENFIHFAEAIERVGRFILDAASWMAKVWREADRTKKGIIAVTAALTALGVALSLPFAPFIAFGALLLLLIEDFQVWREGGKSAIGLLIEGFEDLNKKLEKTTGINIFKLINKSAQILFNVLKKIKDTLLSIGKLIWETFAIGPEKAFEKFKESITNAFNEMLTYFGAVSFETDKKLKETGGKTRKEAKETSKVISEDVIDAALAISSVVVPGLPGLGLGLLRLARKAGRGREEGEDRGIFDKIIDLIRKEEKPAPKTEVPRGVAIPAMPVAPIIPSAKARDERVTVPGPQPGAGAAVYPITNISPAPIMTAPANNVSISYAPKIDVNVEVNGAEPVSAEQIKSDVETVVRRQLDEQNRATMELLVPAATGAR